MGPEVLLRGALYVLLENIKALVDGFLRRVDLIKEVTT